MALFPRLLFRPFCDMAGFLALSEKSAFPILSVAFLTFHNGDDSSGYCSGFAPDSLYTWVEHPVSPMSDAKLIIYGGKAKKVVLIFKSATNKQRFLPHLSQMRLSVAHCFWEKNKKSLQFFRPVLSLPQKQQEQASPDKTKENNNNKKIRL